MPTATDYNEQIQDLQLQISRLKERSVMELRVKLAEAKGHVIALEKQIEQMTGMAPAAAAGAAKPKRTRTSISIDQVVDAIKGGAVNYKLIAAKLGCSPITVAKKIAEEGKAVGIKSTGEKAKFKLQVK